MKFEPNERFTTPQNPQHSQGEAVIPPRQPEVQNKETSVTDTLVAKRSGRGITMGSSDLPNTRAPVLTAPMVRQGPLIKLPIELGARALSLLLEETADPSRPR